MTATKRATLAGLEAVFLVPAERVISVWNEVYTFFDANQVLLAMQHGEQLVVSHTIVLETLGLVKTSLVHSEVDDDITHDVLSRKTDNEVNEGWVPYHCNCERFQLRGDCKHLSKA